MANSESPSDPDNEDKIKRLFAQLDSFFGEPPAGTKPSLAHRIIEAMGVTPPLRLTAIRHTLGQESDRGCVLLAAAFLDDQLAELLRANFVEDRQSSSELLDDDGALGTFSARISACRCLGLLPADATRALTLIRKIRNEFAHEVDVSFETQSVASRCRELFEDPVRKDQNSRQRFITNVFMLLAEIHISRIRVTRPPVPDSLSQKIASAAGTVATSIETARRLLEDILNIADHTSPPVVSEQEVQNTPTD